MVLSDWPTFAEKSQKLIDSDGVNVVFGGWTSASRKAMLPVYEAENHMLFYPIQYEGQECSKNIFYTGAVPNQQAEACGAVADGHLTASPSARRSTWWVPTTSTQEQPTRSSKSR